MQPSTARIALLLGAAALTASACTSLLGDFSVGDGTTGAGGAGGSGGVTATATTGATTTSTTTTTSGTGGTTTGSGGGGSFPCEVSADCVTFAKLCVEAHCKPDFTCEGIPLPAGMGSLPQIAGDCKTAECDGAGSVVYVDDPLDMEDDKDDCTEDTCFGGAPKHTLAGPGAACSVPGNVNAQMCDDNGDCVECIDSGDCAVGLCESGKCVTASCSNLAKDAGESDVDCGGQLCAPCAIGQLCSTHADCASEHCGDVTKKCVPPTCIDGVENQDESDVDCGGPCAPCLVGKTCNVAADCKSEVCNEGVCAFFACSDGILGGNETDVDCGGNQCPTCSSGQTCMNDADCESGSCKPGFTCL